MGYAWAGAERVVRNAMLRRRAGLGLVTALMLLFLGEGLFFIRANSLTMDETIHIPAGYSYLVMRDFRLNEEHPPLVKLLSAIPLYLWYGLPFNPDPVLWRFENQSQIGLNFLFEGPVPIDQILVMARMPNLLLGAILVGLVGWWAYRLWGGLAAVVGASLAALEPNLVAHASLVTTDLGLTLFMVASLYLSWEYMTAPSWRLLAGIGTATGLALASKYSAVVLPGILGLIIGCHLLLGGSVPLPRKPGGRRTARGLVPRIVEAMAPALLVLSLAALVLLAAYFFQGFAHWRQGLRYVRRHNAYGHAAFFLGEYSETGWWSYFLVAFLIKTPVGSLFLVLASLACYRMGRPLGRREVMFLLMPAVVVLAVTTMGHIHIGLRHILPVYPLLFVAASRLATVRLRRPLLVPLVLAFTLALTAISSLRIAPHQLAYFNEIVGGPAEGYRYLSDSNIDWGQDLKSVKAYMDREGVPILYLAYFGNAPPTAYGIRYQYLPATGLTSQFPFELVPAGLSRELLAISVFNLYGVAFRDLDHYRWLRQRTPVARIGYSIFVYDLTGDADAHVRLAEVYLNDIGEDEDRNRTLAVSELRKALRLDPFNPEALRRLSTVSAPIGGVTADQFR